MRASQGATLLRRGRQCLSWLLILAIGAVVLAAVIVPRLGGATPYVIETGSMRPGMPPGTVVVVRPVTPRDIGVGSVITYQLESGQPAVVTHRVVGQGIDGAGQVRFRTQGDANNAVDAGWVRPVQIKGARWYAVPLIGYVTTLITPGLRQALLTVTISVLFGYAAMMFAADLRGRRRSRPEVTS
ncbi:MAG TPA: signal peptidase I [Marmoricola sp.]|nr:signal peptidase I [Marmoricola sp.]